MIRFDATGLSRGDLWTAANAPAHKTHKARKQKLKRTTDVLPKPVNYECYRHMIRQGLTADAANQISFLPVDVCARNLVAISQIANESAPILHMTIDDYHTVADVCATISDIFGYRFDTVSLADLVEHAHANCTEDDPLYPLLSFLDRNTHRILRMGHKRYDNHDYRRARSQAPLTVTHTDLRTTVDPIVRYLINEGLVPPAPYVQQTGPAKVVR